MIMSFQFIKMNYLTVTIVIHMVTINMDAMILDLEYEVQPLGVLPALSNFRETVIPATNDYINQVSIISILLSSASL